MGRLEGLGARRVDVGQAADAGWVVMSDPNGNEFCVLRPLTPAELADSDPWREAARPLHVAPETLD